MRLSNRPRPAWRAAFDAARLYLGLAQLAVMSLAWSLFAVPLNWVMPTEAGQRLGRHAVHYGFRIYLRSLELTGACRFDLKAIDSLANGPPMIIAPNHPSLMDALMILSRLPDIACIARDDILDNLFLGSGARLARYIRNDSAHHMIQLAVAELKGGHSLLLFPEGTRTRRWPVDKVGGAIGLIAKLAEVPVQTLLIETNGGFLAKGWPLFRCPEMPVGYRISLGRRFAPPRDVRRFGGELETYFEQNLAGGPVLSRILPEGCDA